MNTQTADGYWEERGQRSFLYRGERFYTVTPIGLYYQRRQWLLHNLKDLLDILPKDARVLDFGCGDGFYSIHFSRLFPGMRFCGCDIAASMIDQASRQSATEGTDCSFERTDGPIPFEGRFDAIIVVAVFAHVLEDRLLVSILEDMKQHLTLGGRVFLFEATAREIRIASTWQVFPPQYYEALFSSHGFISLGHRTISFQFYDRFCRYLLSVFRLVLFSGDHIRANSNPVYQRLSELCVRASQVVDPYLPSREGGNTLFVFELPKISSDPSGDRTERIHRASFEHMETGIT
jgi:SAM-dependent methyltransferase